MAGRSILIVGANRGIGLNLAKAFTKRKWTVIGSVRPQSKTDPSMEDLVATGARILEIDFLDENSIINAARDYGTMPLDVLVNCGGVHVKPYKWEDHTAEILSEKLRTMAIGPFLTTKHFLPSLKQSSAGVIVNISSDLGSIGLNDGHYLAYRMAKAALNQQTVTLAREMQKAEQNIAVLSLHPGFVATKLTDFDYDDDMDTCIEGMVRVIEGTDMSKTGQYVDWTGKTLEF